MYAKELLLLLGLLGMALVGEAATLSRRLRTTRSRMLTTTSPTPTEKTRPAGCQYQGQFYLPGQSFGEGYDPSSNWCYGAYCSDDGHVLYWDNFQCSPSTVPPTTTPPVTTNPGGCFYNGQIKSDPF